MEKKYSVRNYIIYFLLFFIILNAGGFFYPEFISGDNGSVERISESSSTAINYPVNDLSPAAPDRKNTFFPILITSIGVVGVLAFAMYQTFKSRRQS